MHELTPKDIVKYLLDLGYTQNQIAKLTGVPQSTISRLLAGIHTNPRISTVRSLEKLLYTAIVR
ncbi:helix-turn-helix domain-containing protein [Arsenophonus nasoniae]|uniref:Helix-turn-helix domain-containing protein n=2 Tax=Arsenophonus nasoniae TaxID=638 RepID=A0A4P7L4C3_9GAMM|nr:helix-turn-helix domain-containing protein [Arsenophonus nasoniae]QBY43732.1 helix-turn-helix protein [Arsenophonus nasoniae]WGM00237.1 helix-turn-helix domain-containing protein [Arsenophonus nasoniae]WGM00529.1 helix-turn-helix domain-containing protein [Arsenophonus nasoniae]WGM12518.1 helix-turn-helix domain-containing protein [Arsenophonus nasoniae]WGM17193.1 helix-turn-helix domain-containing protein [Arsenophonus nasoniae]